MLLIIPRMKAATLQPLAIVVSVGTRFLGFIKGIYQIITASSFPKLQAMEKRLFSCNQIILSLTIQHTAQ